MNWKEILTQLFKDQQQAKRLRCEGCKINLEYVLDVGKLGCPKCYITFLPILKRLVEQTRLKHVGKQPKNKFVTELEQQMMIAALEGRFEDAENIKMQIKTSKDEKPKL